MDSAVRSVWWVASVVGLALAFAALPAAAGTFHDARYGVTFTLPDGFEETQEGRENPDVIHVFRRGSADDPAGVTVIGISTLHGTIGRDRIPVEMLPRGASRITGRWRAFEVDGTRFVQTRPDGSQVVVLGLEVPLTPQALQFMFGGPLEREAEITRLAATVLPSVQGRTNWLTPLERVTALGRGLATLGTVLALLAYLLVRFARGSHKAPGPREPPNPPPTSSGSRSR
jgi:hypothetical protein